MGFNYGINKGAGIGPGSAGSGLGGVGLARMLGMAGAAISPKGSWQQRLGAASADMAQKEQGRRYLAELLAGLNGAGEGDKKAEGKKGSSSKKNDESSKLDIEGPLNMRSRDLSLPGFNISSDQKGPIQEQDIRLNNLVEELKSQGYGGD